ncbi:GDSL esterase/lipase At5g45960 [Linum grandiflorum]
MESHYREKKKNYTCFLLLFVLFVNWEGAGAGAHLVRPVNSSVTAVLVFGDSTVDAGNNNFVRTPFKGNFLPYGKDFAGGLPTGRFSNGRLTTDFIAAYAGVKENVPPYLDPSLTIEDLKSGVTFASAGTGFDPMTPQISNVIPIDQQVVYFKEYKKKLEAVMGKQKTKEHIRKSLVVISAATNDFVISYFALPVRRRSFTISQYERFILQKSMDFVQALIDEGVTRVLLSALAPMGCLPVVITLYSTDPIFDRKCLDQYTQVAIDYNRMVQTELDRMKPRLDKQGVKIYISDVYNAVNDMIHRPQANGYDEVNSGCCGTGLLEAGFLCNPHSLVCLDASKYVFWDAIHPSERTYYNVFKAIRPTIDLLIKD